MAHHDATLTVRALELAHTDMEFNELRVRTAGAHSRILGLGGIKWRWRKLQITFILLSLLCLCRSFFLYDG